MTFQQKKVSRHMCSIIGQCELDGNAVIVRTDVGKREQA